MKSQVPGAYADFSVLLDNPAVHPGMGFDDYAEALTEVIVHSRAEFSVGIFGSWGSGKTTLMQAIQRKLPDDKSVIPVWFAAWRYEKDPNLILPLLDVLREALETQDDGKSGWAHDAAVAVGCAGQAFLEGLKLSASLPGIKADFELGKMIEAIRASRERPAPLSLYHAGFRMLHEAIQGLSAGGTRRVVVFIDDLDRCLPTNALDVLESMKLFFDVEGCIFVVGLDQEIAEKAVAVKYAFRRWRRYAAEHKRIRLCEEDVPGPVHATTDQDSTATKIPRHHRAEQRLRRSSAQGFHGQRAPTFQVAPKRGLD